MKVLSYGKGGETSSGSWHITYEKVIRAFNGREVKVEATKSFFTKKAMLKALEA